MTKDVSTLTLRSIRDEEWRGWVTGVELKFGQSVVAERAERWKPLLDLDRCFAVLDGERMVGNAATETNTISLPYVDEPVPCGGVTAVGVAQDWRRRGVLRRLMQTVLDDCRQRGERFASLYASESAIYGRFGFGLAAPQVDLDILSARTAIAGTADRELLEMVDADRLIADAPAIYAAFRRRRPGAMGFQPRMALTWGEDHADERRDGYSPRQHALIDGRGFVVYRWKPSWEQMVPRGTVRVEMLVATDGDAEAALWNHVLEHDLCERVVAPMQAVDSALPFLVDRHEMVQTRMSEHLYLRLVDLPGALSDRGYRADGTLVLEVTDASLVDNAGTWRLQVVDGRATVDRTDHPADLRLDVAELGSVVLGGVRATQLVAGRRIDERRDGAAADLDRLMAADRAPWTPFEF